MLTLKITKRFVRSRAQHVRIRISHTVVSAECGGTTPTMMRLGELFYLRTTLNQLAGTKPVITTGIRSFS